MFTELVLANPPTSPLSIPLSPCARRLDKLLKLDDLRSSKASNGDGNKAGNGKAVPRELEKLRRELTAKQKENKDQEKLLNHQKYILTQRKEELKSMDQRIQELTTRLLKKKRHNQQAAATGDVRKSFFLLPTDDSQSMTARFEDI